MERIIGIDLGTTYSCVAVFNEKRGVFEVVPSKGGEQTTPSVVSITKNGEVCVGTAAKRQWAAKPEETVVEIKRRMGTLHDNGEPYTVTIGGKEHSPEEISAYILGELKEAAEAYLGEPVNAAVITVPAYFEEPQRQATMRAGKLAGLEVKRIINEPTAAAIAYGHDQQEEEEDEDSDFKPLNLLIYDLGGGTFDVSVIHVERGNIRVKATTGDHYLGGIDFDREVVSWITRKIRENYGVDIDAMAKDPSKAGQRARSALGRIRSDAENFKKELSSQQSVLIQFPMLPVPDPSTGEPLDVEIELTRAEFEKMIASYLARTTVCIENALKDARMKPSDIDEVILVGGSTRIPAVQRSVERHFGRAPRTDIHPDLCVAMGAAHEALKHVDIGSVAEPTVRQAMEKAMDELPVVVDVTGHSLGIAVRGTEMSVLIPKQTPIPAAVTKDDYTTAADYQTQVRIQVYQGDSRWVAENQPLGEFLLEIPARRQGEVQVEVSFTLDSNDILTVTARDNISRQERELQIRDPRLRGEKPSGLLPRAGAAETQALPSRGGSLAAPTPEVPPQYEKLVAKAADRIPRLPPAQRNRLQGVLDALYAAARKGDSRAIEDAGNALMDALYDIPDPRN